MPREKGNKTQCTIWAVPEEFKKVTKALKNVNSNWSALIHKLSVLLEDVPEDVTHITIQELVI